MSFEGVTRVLQHLGRVTPALLPRDRHVSNSRELRGSHAEAIPAGSNEFVMFGWCPVGRYSYLAAARHMRASMGESKPAYDFHRTEPLDDWIQRFAAVRPQLIP